MADSLLDFDARHLWHPYDSATEPGAVWPVRAARGARLILEDGRELLDGMSSWWAAIHGYGHPALCAALEDQGRRMAHVMFGGLTHEPAVELGRALFEVMPSNLHSIFYADSGSVSVEVALKMALLYWQRRGRSEKARFLALRGGYHGDTLGAASVTDPGIGLPPPVPGFVEQSLFAPRPEPRFGEPWTETAGHDVAALLQAHAGQLAAVVVEPIVQGAGGMWFYSSDYLRHVRRLCDEHDVLLICDEIATGFGRTGRMFAVEHAGVEPDIMCMGKALTGGMLSLAATVTTERVARGVCPPGGGVFPHGPTFMANPLACAVALASLKELAHSPWQERVRAIEEELRRGLAPCRELASVADVRVLGAIGVVELSRAVDMGALQAALVARGVWLRPFRNLLYAMPPFMMSREETSLVAAAMRDVLEQLE